MGLDVVHVDDGRVDVQLQLNVGRRAQAGSSGAAQHSRASLRITFDKCISIACLTNPNLHNRLGFRTCRLPNGTFFFFFFFFCREEPSD